MIQHAVTDSIWRARAPLTCTDDQCDWLSDRSSLTARLRGLGLVEVTVVREGRDRLWRDERRPVGVPANATIWSREVILKVGGSPCVYARSVLPLRASREAWGAIRQLGDRPLADLLYADEGVSRSIMAKARLGPRHPLQSRLTAGLPSFARQLPFARRSLFLRAQQPLVVMECMLPELWRRIALARGHANTE